MEYKHTIHTNIGVVREENQDRAIVLENKNVLFAILCDGMGGHFGGSIAASISINSFKNSFENNFPNFNIENVDNNIFYNWFKESLRKAKDLMLAEANENSVKMDMGTTLTAALIFKKSKNIIIFNIGDSRTYIYNGLLHQITIDQNLTNYYIKEKQWNEFEASKIPGGAALISSVGPKKKTNVEVFQVNHSDSNNPEFIILTSDGIHDYVSKKFFENIMKDKNIGIDEKSEILIKEAIKGHSTDNLTIIIIEVPDGCNKK